MQNQLTQLWLNHQADILAIAYQLGLALGIIVVARILASNLKTGIVNANRRLGKLDETLIPILSATASYAVYAIAAVVLLDLFGVNTTSIIALIGAAGLAIGFALKDTLSNIAAGIMLLFLRPFKTGHYIEFGGTTGTVEEITLFTTVLCLADGVYISCPNGLLWGNDITNYTRNGRRRMDITASIAYSDSIEVGLSVLNKIAQTESRLLSDPATQVIVFALSESSVDLQLRGWASVDDYWPTLWDLNRRVKEDIEAAGLTIPFPQRDVRVLS